MATANRGLDIESLATAIAGLSTADDKARLALAHVITSHQQVVTAVSFLHCPPERPLDCPVPVARARPIRPTVAERVRHLSRCCGGIIGWIAVASCCSSSIWTMPPRFDGKRNRPPPSEQWKQWSSVLQPYDQARSSRFTQRPVATRWLSSRWRRPAAAVGEVRFSGYFCHWRHL